MGVSFYERLQGEGFLSEDSRRASWFQGFLEPNFPFDTAHVKSSWKQTNNDDN